MGGGGGVVRWGASFLSRGHPLTGASVFMVGGEVGGSKKIVGLRGVPPKPPTMRNPDFCAADT